MWKYVSRRIRDVCDRTYNVLDVRRPWQCGGERFCAEGNLCEEERKDGVGQRKIPYCVQQVAPWKQPPVRIGSHSRNDTGSNHSGREGFRRKSFCPFESNWIGAITWTSAIICGWYTSQLICLYRRNHKWEGPKCLPFLISSAHNIPRGLKDKCCPFSAPPIEEPHAQQQPKTSAHAATTFFGIALPNGKQSRLEEFDFKEFTGLPIYKDKQQQQVSKAQEYGVYVVNEERSLPVEPEAPTVESAMENLKSVIGEIEYHLGVQNLEAGDYGTAVSHLKLGTSHQHAGAAFNLGICYEQGFGVKKNARVAMECFHLASTLGHPEAMYNLGVYYARGLGGLRRSRTMAKRCFMAAADLGLEQAITALGSGYRVRRDSMKAGPSSASPTPSSVVPFEFKFDYDELERYGFVGGYKSVAPMNQVQLVSASA